MAQQETPAPGALACFKCSKALHGIVWEAVTRDRHIVLVCPECSHRYARVRQRNKKFQ